MSAFFICRHVGGHSVVLHEDNSCLNGEEAIELLPMCKKKGSFQRLAQDQLRRCISVRTETTSLADVALDNGPLPLSNGKSPAKAKAMSRTRSWQTKNVSKRMKPDLLTF